jgi:hypothetical protein
MAATPAPANAYVVHNCQYDPDSISPISYKFFDVTSAFQTAFKDGEAAWDATSSPGFFREFPYLVDPEINVTDGSFSGDWLARTTWGCSNGWYSGNEVNIQFDTVDMSDLTAYQKKITAEHELGHAYGLADTPQTGCRVMRQGEYKWTCGSMPAADDINGVNYIY